MFTSRSKYDTDLSIINDQIVCEIDAHDGKAYSASPNDGSWFFNPGEQRAYLFENGEWQEISKSNFDITDTVTYAPSKEFDYSIEAQYMDELDEEEREAFGLDPIEIAE